MPQTPFTGQGLVLHLFLSTRRPTHGLPPFRGDGLLHARVFVMYPPPHFREHFPHFDHFDHPPFTGHGFKLHFTFCTLIP